MQRKRAWVQNTLTPNEKVRANKIMQTAWWWSALNNLREEVSFLLPSTTKKRSGRSLKLGKEEPKDEGGEGVVKVKVYLIVIFL